MSLRIAAALTFAVLAVSTTGCAADGEEPDTVEVETQTTVDPNYIARVTRMDIIEGGGRCAGNLCTIGSTTWNCGGGGYCSRIQF